MKALGRRRVRRFKSQSAMEYLMTYGWAILIIAVVLGALYSLGVFNSTNFAPKAPPGSCHVFRPNGPGTTFDLNLEGVCNGELPEYVASFSGGSKISSGVSDNGWSGITESVWLYISSSMSTVSGDNYAAFGSLGACPDGATILVGNLYIDIQYTLTTTDASNSCLNNWLSYTAVPNKWYFVVFTFNGTTGSLYVDGKLEAQNKPTNTLDTIWSSTAIGMGGWNGFLGYLANAQIYNTSLSQAEITALYQEGIGGAPIDLQNLVGWWPLNGDANDYSGNGNNGVPSSITFVSNWWSGYTPP